MQSHKDNSFGRPCSFAARRAGYRFAYHRVRRGTLAGSHQNQNERERHYAAQTVLVLGSGDIGLRSCRPCGDGKQSWVARRPTQNRAGGRTGVGDATRPFFDAHFECRRDVPPQAAGKSPRTPRRSTRCCPRCHSPRGQRSWSADTTPIGPQLKSMGISDNLDLSVKRAASL